ncbi:MAG: TetR family transcriptional regulator [Kordiimonadaceae bacterium]|jgi:TetR/AcrR family transcriptional regulator, transcriptional repressor of bet genes|nr:TetR family transcriptional regulator [Kordiimonadaceae bacterium]MBT6032349.1 TetR family transcriptional regulator [Kordiimonadaceae bacterium]
MKLSSEKKFSRIPKDDRRMQIVEATMISLSKLGPEKTTVRVISEQAGVSPGLINHHFKNKDELILQAFIYANEEYSKTKSIAVDKAGKNPINRLKAYVGASFQPPPSLNESVGLWSAFWFLSWQDSSLSSLHKVIYNNDRRVLELLIQDVMIASNIEGDIKANSLELAAMLDGFWLELGLGHNTFTKEEARYAFENWLKKLLVQ